MNKSAIGILLLLSILASINGYASNDRTKKAPEGRGIILPVILPSKQKGLYKENMQLLRWNRSEKVC